MKITVTKAELLTILSKHFGVEIMECTIAKPDGKAKSVIGFLCKTFTLSVPLRQTELNTGTFKIPAIKAIREWHQNTFKETMGLADAKWAIENWERWIEFVSKTGRMPQIYNHWNPDITALK